MTKVVQLPGTVGAPPPAIMVNEELVNLLERMTVAAKEGKFTSFTGITIGPDGKITRFRLISQAVNYYTLRGVLDWLKDDFVKSQGDQI